MNVYQFLLEKAKEQLDKAAAKSEDKKWLDDLLSRLRQEVTSTSLDDPLKQAAFEALDKLEENKALLVGLGVEAFTLFLYQICACRDAEAVKTYIQALTNADDLILLMNSTSDGVIQAKIILDQQHAAAKKLLLDVATAGLRVLLPFLLSLV